MTHSGSAEVSLGTVTVSVADLERPDIELVATRLDDRRASDRWLADPAGIVELDFRRR